MALNGEVYTPPSQQAQPARLPPDAEKWRSWWVIPLWVGVGIIVVSVSLMYAALRSSIDEIILALVDHSATPENPAFISVNDEEDGENVQIL
jgi:hypothetical protein